MHNSMCCRKLTCLLCACDRDFKSYYHRRTSKKTNVSFNKTQFRKVYISDTGRGNGATGVHRAFSDGYQGESIEHSLMESDGPQEGKEEHKRHNSMCSRKLTCLLCNCQSDYRRRTGKTVNVSFNKQSMSASPKQSMSASTTLRPTVPWRPFRAFPGGHQGRAHRAFSNGPHRGKLEHKLTYRVSV